MDYGLGEEQGVLFVKNGDWASAIIRALANKDSLSKLARRYVEQEHEYDRIVSMLETELTAVRSRN